MGGDRPQTQAESDGSDSRWAEIAGDILFSIAVPGWPVLKEAGRQVSEHLVPYFIDGGESLDKQPGGKTRQAGAERVSDSCDDARDTSSLKNPEALKLCEAARGKICDQAQWQAFLKDINDFETRAGKDGLASEEITRTYREIGRLFESKSGAAVGDELRVRLAREAMHMVANPYSVDQGEHKTCNVSTLGVRLYARNPADAVRVVADVATSSDGAFKTLGGKDVAIDNASLTPDSEAEHEPVADGKRNYVNQVLNLAMVNAALAGRSEMVDAGGRKHTGPFHYQQKHDVSSSDSGESVVDGSGNVVARSPGLTNAQLAALYGEFSAEKTDPFFVVHESLTKAGNDSPLLIKVDSASALTDQVKEAQRKGNMPLVVSVDPESELWANRKDAGDSVTPADGQEGFMEVVVRLIEAIARKFRQFSPYPSAAAVERREDREVSVPEREAHVVNLRGWFTDPQSRKTMIDVSNQWGSASDFPVEQYDLYASLAKN